MPEVNWHTLRRRIAAGLAAGAKRSGTTRFVYDVAGNCESSLLVEQWARKPPELVERDKRKRRHTQDLVDWINASMQGVMGPVLHERAVPPRQRKYATGGREAQLLQLEMHVRCRKCRNCMKVRSRMWYARAMAETALARRTWFVTLTLRPEAHFMSLARARRAATRSGVLWEELTQQEQFARTHRQNGVQLQLWLKRLRKNSGATIRFLLVCEAHKSGLPHYHALLHQCDDRPLNWKHVTTAWREGFVNAKLVDNDSHDRCQRAGYLCKYLSKSVEARVRASTRYGEGRSQSIVQREVAGITPTQGSAAAARASAPPTPHRKLASTASESESREEQLSKA